MDCLLQGSRRTTDESLGLWLNLHLKGCLSECHPSPARGPRIDVVVQGVRLTTGIATGRIDVGCKRDRTAPKRRGEDGSDEEIVELDRRFGGAMQ